MKTKRIKGRDPVHLAAIQHSGAGRHKSEQDYSRKKEKYQALFDEMDEFYDDLEDEDLSEWEEEDYG